MKLHGLVAKKIGMTRVINPDGQMVPVTLLQIEKQKVTKILTVDRDGYHGFQVGYLENAEHRLNKPDLTRLRKSSIAENFTRFREYNTGAPIDGLELGKELDLEMLSGIFHVDIAGITKGHGFEGATSRHHTAMGRETHGSRHHRRPGSLGMRTSPGRVVKGKKMPGHMGDANRTIQNLKVVEVDHDMRVVAVKGSVPGHRNGYVVIKPSVKRPSEKKA